MRILEEIKTAAAALDPEEPVKLFEWWVQTEPFKKRQLAKLKADIARGFADIESGNYQTYTEENLMKLAEDIGQSGRDPLN